MLAIERRTERLICRYLAELADRVPEELDRVLWGYADELHAARCVFGLGVRETRERVRVGRALRELPRVEAAFVSGEVSYSRVRRYVGVHHIIPRGSGGQHSRGNCLVLCRTHHLLHDGKLELSGDAEGELYFRHAEGHSLVDPASPAELPIGTNDTSVAAAGLWTP